MRAPGTTILATAAALICFAGNSILCRLALREATIDAWSFTLVRLASGAVAIALLARLASPEVKQSQASFASAAALFGYAAAFSLAYLRLGASVGALVLFASVQATMIGWGIRGGSRPTRAEWMGLAIALGGLLVLTRPGAVAPDPLGLVLMAIAGVAWGAYSLRGRSSLSPLVTTAGNFVRSVPLALVGYCLGWKGMHFSARGVCLAVASGALASGVGYSLWYLALPALGATRAALLQLLVPVLTAVLGIALLGEQMTERLAIAAPMILGGVAIAVLLRGRPVRDPAR